MATIRIDFDAEALARLDNRVRLLTDQNLRFVASKALTGAAQSAQAQLKQETPRFIDNPTRWTLGGTYVKFAKASSLEAEVGFRQDMQGRGNAAGRYLLPIVKGTTPKLKGADLSATKIAGQAAGAVLVPAKGSPLRPTAAGNYTISAYAKVLASARAGGQGRPYFLAPVRQGSSTQAIFTRTGRGGKQLRRVFTIDPNPKTRRPQFPVREILTKAFGQAWPAEVRRAYEAEVARRLGRA
jgi:hypothetical protein